MSVFCLYCIGVHSSQSRFCQLINSSFLIQARVFCGDALPPRLSYPIAHKVSMRYRLSQPSISPPPPPHFPPITHCIICSVRFVSSSDYLNSQADSRCLNTQAMWAFHFSASFRALKREQTVPYNLRWINWRRKPHIRKKTKTTKQPVWTKMICSWICFISIAQLILY